MRTVTLPAASTALAFATLVYAQSSTARPPIPGAPAGVTAFVHVNVIPMDTARVLREQTVLVEGGRIRLLGPSAKLSVPAGATQIDGRGKYLMPGLGDCHVHICFGKKNRSSTPSPSDASAAAERRLFRWLADGLTTVRNMD